MHNCESTHANLGSCTEESDDTSADLLRQISALGQEKEELGNENEVLEMRCKQLSTELNALKENADQLRKLNDSNCLLLQKHEQCATDGTRTIEALQESLAKVCEQITLERTEHNERLNQIAKAFSAKEDSLIHEIEELKVNLKKVQTEADSRQITENVEQDGPTLRHEDIQPTPASENDSQASSPRKVGTSDHITIHSNGTWSNDVVAPWRHVISEEIDDDDEVVMSTVPFSVNSASTPSRKSVTKNFFSEPSKSKKTLSKEDCQRDESDCRYCGEEPFGFMIKCQQCKDLYHAGCVNNATKNGKRRAGQVFICSDCAPQRPHKVPRASITSPPGVQQPAATVPRRPTLT